MIIYKISYYIHVFKVQDFSVDLFKIGIQNNFIHNSHMNTVL